MLWHKYKPDEPFPVSTCYLSKIFEMLGDMYDVDIRHELGTTFSIILKEHAVVSIQAMTNVLSDSQFTCAGTSRENIEQLYKQLSTIYAFLFPDSLCEFAQRVQVTSTLGQITHLSDQLLKQSNTSESGTAFAQMGPVWILSQQVRMFIKSNKSQNGPKYLRGNTTTLQKNI